MPIPEVIALDRALARAGEDVALIRGTVSVPCRAIVKGLSATTVRPGSITSVGNYRAILSPTPILTASPTIPLPIRSTDRLKIRGEVKTITFANSIHIGSDLARIELDVMG